MADQIIDFWDKFVPLAAREIPLFKNAKHKSNAWFERVSKIKTSLARYSFNPCTKDGSVAVYVCIEKGKNIEENEEIYHALKKYEEEINSLFEGRLVWQGNESRQKKEGGQNKSFRIYHQYNEHNLDYRNEMDFKTISDFLIPSMTRLIEVFDKYFELIEISNENDMDVRKIGKILSRINRGKEDFEQKFGKHKIRIFQDVFRDCLLRIYKKSCAICGVSFEAALEAAHIVPDAKGGTYESQNGILLCATHHKLFESHIITIAMFKVVFQA